MELELDGLFDLSQDVMIVRSLRGELIAVNPACQRLLGWRPDEIANIGPKDLIHPDERESLGAAIDSALKVGGSHSWECRALKKDGSYRWIHWSGTVDVAGDRWYSVGRDITERRLQSSHLRESQANLAWAQTLSHIGSWSLNMASGSLSISDEFYRITGYEPGDYPPTRANIVSSVHPDDRHLLEDRPEGIDARSWRPAQFDLRIVRPSGEVRNVTSFVDIRFDSKGAPEMMHGTIHDVTERKQADSKLQAQLTRLELLSRITRAIAERQDLQSINQVVVRTLEDHLPLDFACICLYNPVENSLSVSSVGIGCEELAASLAMTESARIPVDQNGLSRCVQGHLVYEPDVARVNFPFPQRLLQGGLRSFVGAPLTFESQVFGVLIAARGVPDAFSSGECEFLRQLSEHIALAAHQADLHFALQNAYDDLRRTQQTVVQQERLRALGQMASGIAHDINNAISPIALYTESLLESEPNLSSRARDYLVTISRSIDDVAATVARMREFYRQRETQLVFLPVQLGRIVREVVDLTQARWSDLPQQQGIVIDVKTELDDELPNTMGIESEIRELLTNLVFNSVDAMPDGGQLTLRTSTRAHDQSADSADMKRRVVLEVRDTGVGMDELTRRRCLEPFFTTKGERGTGLGLAMVYGIVQRHGADVEIESEVGVGTVVRVAFAVPADPIAGASMFRTDGSVVQPLRILLVDDDPLLLKSLCDALESDGHIVAKANGGQAGIDAVQTAIAAEKPFEVVITDLGMPSVDGRKVAAAIKEVSASTFVILLTGWGQRLASEGDIPPHVDCVLSKPPRLRELREALALRLASAET